MLPSANHEQNCWVANTHTASFRSTETNHHADPQDKAALSYANREFSDAEHTLGELIDRQADNPRWYEMRAQVSDRLSVRTCTSCMSSGYALRWSVYRHRSVCWRMSSFSMMETCHADWLQVLVDGKDFRPAIKDFDKALELYPGGCAPELNALPQV